ncbi:hypothetical protein HYV88_06430 [Candidatus Woesearchaeota archaeon]|nr:hypothetical protein [Candidatus Woesearchaeota archaeon]
MTSSRVTKQDIITELVKHNVELLKKNADLVTSVNNLIKKVDELVEIFKKAAQNIEKGEVREPLARKLTDLLEQNKRIARGLLLLEKFVRDKETFSGIKKKEAEGGLF